MRKQKEEEKKNIYNIAIKSKKANYKTRNHYNNRKKKTNTKTK